LSRGSQSRRSAAGVINALSRLRIENASHQDGNFAWRVKLARTLALALRKFPQQIFVSPAEDVWFDIVEAETVFRLIQNLSLVS
jgi:hypothetical protein